jgi:hypothetical protein
MRSRHISAIVLVTAVAVVVATASCFAEPVDSHTSCSVAIRAFDSGKRAGQVLAGAPSPEVLEVGNYIMNVLRLAVIPDLCPCSDLRRKKGCEEDAEDQETNAARSETRAQEGSAPAPGEVALLDSMEGLRTFTGEIQRRAVARAMGG